MGDKETANVEKIVCDALPHCSKDDPNIAYIMSLLRLLFLSMHRLI